MNTKERKAFRCTEQWKAFSLFMRESIPYCEGCNTDKNLGVHHQRSNKYDRLTPTLFNVLCWECHKKFHQKQFYLPFKYKNKKKRLSPKWKSVRENNIGELI